MAATEHVRPNTLDRIDTLAIKTPGKTRNAADWWSNEDETPICSLEHRRENRIYR